MFFTEDNFHQKETRIKRFYLLLLFFVYSMISLTVYLIFNKTQPDPYMDEIYHIPQGIKYIKGNLTEYDKKIPTLPGLYIVTSIMFNLISITTGFSFQELCQPCYMRLVNLFFSICSVYAIFNVITFRNFFRRKVPTPRRAFWVTLTISLFPISYFFNFMYYTESLSTFLVIMMYKEHLKGEFGNASILGTFAVLVRQTNIIWIGYLIIDLLFQLSVRMLERREVSANDFVNFIWVIRSLKVDNILWEHAIQFYRLTRSYIQVCIIFIAFLLHNNGIAVGDRDAYTAVIHICQIFYFSIFTLVLGFPHYFQYFKKFLKTIYENKITSLIIVIICCLVIYFNTMTHHYLLADNRHYSFYVWKRIYEKYYFVKYLLVPVYMYALFAITININIHLRTQFWLCTFFCLVPHKLLDFRYFIIPYIMLRIEMDCKSRWHLIIEFSWFLFINCLTVYIFTVKEIYCSGNIHRIIW